MVKKFVRGIAGRQSLQESTMIGGTHTLLELNSQILRTATDDALSWEQILAVRYLLQ